MKLSKCKCGKEVEIKYQAGIAPSLAAKCGIKNSKGYPRYYITCDCGNFAEIRVDGITTRQRDRQKNALVRLWNKRRGFEL